MNDLNDCLTECINITQQRAEYLKHRLQQKQALDAEIEHLRDVMRQDFLHIAALSNLTGSPPASAPEASVPPMSVPEAPTAPVAPPEPEVKIASKHNTVPPRRPILRLDATGKVLQRFESVRAAERSTGCCCSQIFRAATNKFATRDGSFWRYEDDKTPVNVERPVIVESYDGNLKYRYASTASAACALGISFNRVQRALRSDTHRDEKAQCYCWYEDEYNKAHNNNE